MLLQELEDADCRKMPTLLVGSPRLQGGDEFAPSFDLAGGHHSRLASIYPMRVPGTALATQQSIKRRAADAIER